MMQITKTDAKATQGVVFGIVAALVIFLLFKGRVINHDTAWYLVAVERWMAGAELYQTIIEVNPPINFYFTLPSYGLTQLTDLTLSDAQIALTSLTIGGVLAWGWHILASHDRSKASWRVVFMLMVAAALVVPALKHFAQRDHLLVLFLTPWALSLTFSEEGAEGWGGARRGAFAALGICLKPHFLVFPLCATIALMLRERSLRPVVSTSNMSIVTVGAAYVAFVWVFHQTYFDEIVPIGLLVYDDFGLPDRWILFNLGLIQLLFVLLMLAEFMRRRSAPRSIGVIAAMFVAGILSYVLQWKGYTYQSVPLRSFSLLLCAFVFLRCRMDAVGRSALICFLVIASLEIAGGFYRSKTAETLVSALSEEKVIHSLSVFSSHVYVGPIVALNLGASWENRYPALWTVPGIVNARAETDCVRASNVCDALSVLATATRRNVFADLQLGKPEVIIFDKKSGYFDEAGFSYETFLRQSEDISLFLDGYQRRLRLDRFDILYRE